MSSYVSSCFGFVFWVKINSFTISFFWELLSNFGFDETYEAPQT